MNDLPQNELLSAYLDGELTAAEQADVERLLAANPAARQLLDELPATQAEALTLHCVLGFTVEEAAEVSNVPANTLRGRLITAKALLRRKLAEDPELSELLSGVS